MRKGRQSPAKRKRKGLVLEKPNKNKSHARSSKDQSLKETRLDESLLVQGTKSKQELVTESVSKLLAADQHYVSSLWQAGVCQRKRKSSLKKRNASGPAKQETPTSNGLHQWSPAHTLSSRDQSSSFPDCGLSARISEVAVNKLGLEAPSSVQQLLIPSVLAGHDVICGAGIGSGKTIGYILPILQGLMSRDRRINRTDGTRVIVLCQDIQRCEAVAVSFQSVMNKVCWWLTVSVFAGGENRNHEKSRLRKGVSVMITTETRLLDHLENTAAFDTTRVETFVVDNAFHLLSSKRERQRMQNIVCTSGCHADLAFLCVCMLRHPVSVGFVFRLGANKRWTAEAEPGWNIEEAVPDHGLSEDDASS